MEGQKGLKDGTAWKRTGGVSRLNDSHFSVEMEMREEQFLSNITTSPQILQRYKNLGLSNKTIEQIGNFTLAMGFIYGTGRNLRDIWINSGDAGEVNTWADMYAVFFKLYKQVLFFRHQSFFRKQNCRSIKACATR